MINGYESLISGALSGTITAIILQPLDVIKTRQVKQEMDRTIKKIENPFFVSLATTATRLLSQFISVSSFESN